MIKGKLCLVIILFSLLFGNKVSAVEEKPKIKDENFSAKYVSQSVSDPIKILAGEKLTITVKFKNIGTSVWKAKGLGFVSAYTYNPRYHESDFQGTNWLSESQTAPITRDTKPGEIAELKIDLQAPNTPGKYKEEFHLASEGYSWVKNGSFFLEFNVVENTKEKNISEEKPAEIYLGERLMQSVREVEVAGGEKIKMVFWVGNTSEKIWENFSLEVENNQLYTDETWINPKKVFQKNEPIEKNGEVRETIFFRAPPKIGEYAINFKVKAGENEVKMNAPLTVKIKVIADAPTTYTPVQFSEELVPPPTYRLNSEPRVRVGIWKNPEAEVHFISNEADYGIYNGEINVGILPKGTLAKMRATGPVHTFLAGDISFSTGAQIFLRPIGDEHAVFIIPTLTRKISWKGPKNFNAYRGIFELTSTDSGKENYVVNDVLLEDYVAGIAETSNISPKEYIKALLTAARTYAYYTKIHTTKHDSRNIDLVAHTGDQLYLGYESEKLMPNVAAAARETRGEMVTYKKEIVVTPYFANSDGRTRGWNEIWGGKAKPWLVSVKADYDKKSRLKMYGHGVGMSARDAAVRADKEKVSYLELLKYYYRGVEIERVYE